MKITTVIGARPQFIKAAAVTRAIAKYNQSPIANDKPPISELIIHTGQHYDHNMSRIFFEELNIPEPDINLEVGSGSHGGQTAQMLSKLEKELTKERPDYLLVYGDTNSTLAGALAASKLHIPVAHVEAGLRSFNRKMPEEINRIVADHLSTILFCPTRTAVENLKNEGIFSRGTDTVNANDLSSLARDSERIIMCCGDVMYDSILYNAKLAEKRSRVLETFDLKTKKYALVTIHRAENTDDRRRLESIITAFCNMALKGLPVIIPLHPRTRKKIMEFGIKFPQAAKKKLHIIDPVSYLDMLMLEKNAKIILTDSGGVQKESYWFEVPCITLRDETEWVETVESGWNRVVGTDQEKITEAFDSLRSPTSQPNLFGDGTAAPKIVQTLVTHG